MSSIKVPDLKPLAAAMLARYRADDKTPPVVLFVLGAAASFRSRMPSWEAIKGDLIEAAELSFRGELFVDEAWKQLAPYIGPPPAPPIDKKAALRRAAKTEQILGVACAAEVVRDQVVAVLTNTFGKTKDPSLGEAPQLGYELIAHFLRHGFVDHVVNFNFDEALDIALDNELGRHGYDRILSESDVVTEVAAWTRPPRRPHYLKLHGTISIPSSLRFTKDHTQSIPAGMLRTLDQIAFEDGSRRLHLVTLGYSWNDPDFVNWVVARAELIDHITIVRGGEKTRPQLLVARYEERRRDLRDASAGRIELPKIDEMVSVVAASQIKIEPRIETATDDVLWALANGIEAQLRRESLDYVPVARHVILGHIFGPERQHYRGDVPVKWGFDPLNKHTSHVRLRLELWLHLFKCKGMMNISGIAETPRIQTYMERVGTPSDIAAYLPRGAEHGSPVQVRETLLHEGDSANAAFDALIQNAILSLNPSKIQVPTFDVVSGKINLAEKRGEAFVRDLFAQIWESDETEVTTASDPRVKWLFRDPRPLTSYLALRNRTNALLQGAGGPADDPPPQPKWTHLLVVAESGEWLAKWLDTHHLPKRARPRKILLIRVGDQGLTDAQPGVRRWGAWERIKKRNEALFAKARPAVEVNEMMLPWWRHNRHLTLAATKEEGGDVSFHGGIYFRRRLKTSRIAPVALMDPKDCFELFLIFLSYATRAVREGDNGAGEAFLKTLVEIAEPVETREEDPRLTALIEALRSRADGAAL